MLAMCKVSCASRVLCLLEMCINFYCFLLAFTVDNGEQRLKEHLLDEMDYKLLPEDIWHYLVSIYGLMEGQEAICRSVRNYLVFPSVTLFLICVVQYYLHFFILGG